MSNRIDVLRASLAKKQAAFDARLADHMGDVRSANGQPLNDKRGGSATIARWDRQNDALRNARKGVEKTEAAIEREASLAANIAVTDVHPVLRAMADAGELIQWRKHPETFFVPGVDRGRIVWVAAKNVLGVRYAEQVPKDQYPKFRDTFNKARAAITKAEGGAA